VYEGCTECGLAAEQLSVRDAADLIDGLGPRFQGAFAAGGSDRARIRAKPDPAVWSPLEYAVHVRDAVRYHGALVNRALKEDRPAVPAADPDGAAQELRYNEADLDEVLDRLEQQSRRFAARVRPLTDDDLERVVINAGRERTVRYMIRNVAHEGHHHLLDVQRLLAE
jgi:hypothetical protein